jgi:hypothetical protein
MGVNAYFPLRDRLLPADADLWPELLDGWRGTLAEIGRFRLRHGLGDTSLVFTELGYTPLARSTLQPWAYSGFGVVPGPDGPETPVVWSREPPRPVERALAVRALAQANRELHDQPLDGVLWWKLTTVPSHVEIEPFALLLGSDDPLLDELRRLRQ